MWLVVRVLGPLRFWLILAFVKKMTKTRQQHKSCIYTYTTFITLSIKFIYIYFHYYTSIITFYTHYITSILHYPLRFRYRISINWYTFICLFVIYPITIHLSIYIVCFPLSLFVIYRQFIILNLFGVSSLCSELILFDSAVYIAFYLFCLCIKRFWLIELICFIVCFESLNLFDSINFLFIYFSLYNNFSYYNIISLPLRESG